MEEAFCGACEAGNVAGVLEMVALGVVQREWLREQMVRASRGSNVAMFKTLVSVFQRAAEATVRATVAAEVLAIANEGGGPARALPDWRGFYSKKEREVMSRELRVKRNVEKRNREREEKERKREAASPAMLAFWERQARIRRDKGAGVVDGDTEEVRQAKYEEAEQRRKRERKAREDARDKSAKQKRQTELN